jgi:hypothetical protein
LIVAGTACGILYKWRKETLKCVQIEFLCFLLVGMLMISIGGLMLALELSTGTCTASVWFINIGYVMELVPALIRVSAIIIRVRASQKMRVVKVDMKKLLSRSICFSILVISLSFFLLGN